MKAEQKIFNQLSNIESSLFYLADDPDPSMIYELDEQLKEVIAEYSKMTGCINK